MNITRGPKTHKRTAKHTRYGGKPGSTRAMRGKGKIAGREGDYEGLPGDDKYVNRD